MVMRSKVVWVVDSTVTRVESWGGVRWAWKKGALRVEGVNQDCIAGRDEKQLGGKRQGVWGAKKRVRKVAAVTVRRRGRGCIVAEVRYQGFRR